MLSYYNQPSKKGFYIYWAITIACMVITVFYAIKDSTFTITKEGVIIKTASIPGVYWETSFMNWQTCTAVIFFFFFIPVVFYTILFPWIGYTKEFKAVINIKRASVGIASFASASIASPYKKINTELYSLDVVRIDMSQLKTYRCSKSIYEKAKKGKEYTIVVRGREIIYIRT